MNYGYFIAKTKDEHMDLLVKKFEKVYGEKPSKLKIRFFDEEPLSVKNVRYNQSGIVCYCIEGHSIGKQKVKNLWEDKECLPSCEYASPKNGQKPSCIREGTLKFILPEISLDRVWLMKIRGVTIINKISNYIETQKILGNSVKGDFYMFLKKEKQTRKLDGKSFTNYTIDIFKPDDDIENNATRAIPSTEQKTTMIKNEKESVKTEAKKETKKSKKKEEKQKVVDISSNVEQKQEIVKTEEYDFNNCYAFCSLEPTTVVDKNGKQLKYTAGKFFDMQDNNVFAIVKDDLAKELENCDLGTILSLEIVERLEKNWVTGFKFVQKCTKKVAA